MRKTQRPITNLLENMYKSQAAGRYFTVFACCLSQNAGPLQPTLLQVSQYIL